MFDFNAIRGLVYLGYGIAARYLGADFQVYRPPNGLNPLAQENYVDTRKISIDQDWTYKKTKKYGDPTWQFLPENGLTLQNYDYLVGPDNTYFITDVASDERLNPIICVECNANITLYKNISARSTGTNAYQAYDPFTGQKLLENCPVSLLQHTRFDPAGMKLPTSVKLPFYQITAPDFPNIVIRTGDVIQDDKGRRLAVINAEKTKKSLGFRIIASELGV